ncbi:MAG: acyltransferase [Deltaproteobacteria bacterium]|nr:acyltransferase [Deltaproteobacteria bacterium]MBW2613554.1 acyltransferase [Deltaproteobacteria bacterium]MBW2634516.1 acyltransferase [Deltaproteobacteria bacterium]MBW2677962.1 acyltransferase [Deltaproteobacteria bacterium]
MRKDHRPYFLKQIYLRFQKLYGSHFLKPQLQSLGRGCTFMKPWHVEIFGGPIHIGEFATIIASADKKVRISVWPGSPEKGAVHIGNYGMLCPGVRISSADEIRIGDSCMFANNAYITDSDWHDIYNRVITGRTAPVHIADNVWIGDSVIVCKGVSIGANSIVGAGAVVTGNIPANAIAAGNPARVVKRLDPEREITTRAHWFNEPERLFGDFDRYDREMLKNNRLLNWLRHLLFPSTTD